MWFQVAVLIVLVLVVIKLFDIGRTLLSLHAPIVGLTMAAETVARATSLWTPATSANDKYLIAPLVTLVRGWTCGVEDGWRIENHGLGPAINVRCRLSPEAAEPLCIGSSLPVGHGLAMPCDIAARIDESIERAASIAAKARDLAAEGYRYTDLYGDANLKFEVTLEFESLKGDRYCTTAAWSSGNKKTIFAGYA